MTLLWTKSNSSLSKLIRWMTADDCSHFSILFKSPGGGLLFESNLIGTHPTFYQTSMKKHEIVHSIEVRLSDDEENVLWDKWVSSLDGKGYDFLGALYLGLCCLRERLTKKPRPKVNAWAKDGLYFCDEIYCLLSDVPGLPVINSTGGMDTPHDVFTKYVQGGDSGHIST